MKKVCLALALLSPFLATGCITAAALAKKYNEEVLGWPGGISPEARWGRLDEDIDGALEDGPLQALYQARLGDRFEQGGGVQQDLNCAYFWYERASRDADSLPMGLRDQILESVTRLQNGAAVRTSQDVSRYCFEDVRDAANKRRLAKDPTLPLIGY